jgi:hypothetical protein
MDTAGGRRFAPATVLADFALIILAVALLLGAALHLEHGIAGDIGFAIDDAWIHATLARNLVEGTGFAVNPGESLPISSSPAWTLALASLYAVTGDMIAAGLSAAFLCTVLSGLLVYLTVRRLSGERLAGLVGAACVVLDPLPLWGLASGMEIPMVLLSVSLLLFAYYAYAPDSRVRAFGVPAALALAVWSRPELMALIPLALLDTWIRNARLDDAEPRARAWRILGLQAGVLAVALAPYFAFDWITSGHPFPTTFYAKVGAREVGLVGAIDARDPLLVAQALVAGPAAELQRLTEVLLLHNHLVLPLAAIGFLAFTRRLSPTGDAPSPFLPIALLAVPAAMGVVMPTKQFSNVAYRYYAPFVPMVAVLAALAVSLCARQLAGRAARLALGVGLALLVCVLYLKDTDEILVSVAEDVANTQRLYVEMAQWLRDHVEPDEAIAVNDIGAIAFFSNHHILDVMGLASPEMWPVLRAKQGVEREEAMYAYLRERGVRYLVISPRYYPDLAADRSRLRPLRQWEARFPTGRMISPQILYEIDRTGAAHPARRRG